MKKHIAIMLVGALCLLATDCLARGGFSSSGGRGGFSSAGRSSFSGSSSRSYSGGSSSYSRPASRSVTTTTTTINRNYYGRGYYGMGYGYHPMMYGGFGYGFGYSNGIMEGLIIGSLMHPSGTVVYNGGGYTGQALLYPNGMVVDGNGMQVGTYQNGQFTAVQNGQFVAQQAPANAQQQMQGAQPVLIEQDNTGWEVLGAIVIVILVIFIIAALT